jgi:thiol:disulfide interchange protein DsbC
MPPRLKPRHLAAHACAAAIAVAAVPSLAGEDDIRRAVEAAFAPAKVSAVSATPLSGVFEVIVGDQIVYADAQGKFLFQGHLIDLQAKLNLTDERRKRLTAIDFDSLPLHLAVKIVKGNGSRVFASFEDPFCGYCRQLHLGLKQMTDYTQYVFLVPMLGENSRRQADRLWCAKNHAQAVSSWMADNVKPRAEAGCTKTPLRDVAALGTKLRILGTPTLFLSDGSRIPSYLPPDKLDAALSRVRPQ